MNLPISKPHGAIFSKDATSHHFCTFKHQYSNQSPRLTSLHHNLHPLPPSGGSFFTLTCSSLPHQQYNNEANPPSKPPSTTGSKPHSLETKLNVSPRTPDLPTPATTDAPNELPTPTTIAQPSHFVRLTQTGQAYLVATLAIGYC